MTKILPFIVLESQMRSELLSFCLESDQAFIKKKISTYLVRNEKKPSYLRKNILFLKSMYIYLIND